MTVQELITKLQSLPRDATIYAGEIPNSSYLHSEVIDVDFRPHPSSRLNGNRVEITGYFR